MSKKKTTKPKPEKEAPEKKRKARATFEDVADAKRIDCATEELMAKRIEEIDELKARYIAYQNILSTAKAKNLKDELIFQGRNKFDLGMQTLREYESAFREKMFKAGLMQL